MPNVKLRSNTRLPHKIQKLLSAMYAGKTGLSGRQILDFFAQHSMRVPVYEAFPTNTRRHIFEHCLSLFPLNKQKQLIEELLTTGRGWYGQPNDDDVAVIREWLGNPRKALPVVTRLSELDWPKVRKEWQKASDRVSEDPAAAITSARTLIETTCWHILHERNRNHSADGDLPRLYRATMEALGTTFGGGMDSGQRQVLQGCLSIVNGISQLRNALGDAHGHGPQESRVDARIARLAVNAAGTLVNFLIEVHASTGPYSLTQDSLSTSAGNLIAWPK